MGVPGRRRTPVRGLRRSHDRPARAHEALARIRLLYDAEVEARPLDDAGRLGLRREWSRPLLDALFNWLEGERVMVLPKSPMGVAVGYALGNRAALTRYTDAGFLPIDHNASERALRAVAVGRKNYLFAGSDAGGRSAAILYSVGTCRRLGLDPFRYPQEAFGRIPGLPPGRVDEFLPDRWAAAAAAGARPGVRFRSRGRPGRVKIGGVADVPRS